MHNHDIQSESGEIDKIKLSDPNTGLLWKTQPSGVTSPVYRLTLNHMRVVLQEEVVQVFGDEGRHAGIC